MDNQYQRCPALPRHCALILLLFGCAVPRIVRYERPYPPEPSVVQHSDRCAITFPAVHDKQQIMLYPLPDLEPVKVSRFGVVLSGECPLKTTCRLLENNELGEIFTNLSTQSEDRAVIKGKRKEYPTKTLQ